MAPIIPFDPARLESAYGILCHGYGVSRTVAGPLPIEPTWCVVGPGEASTPHRHHEPEVFVVIAGEGQMRIGARTSTVRAGDLIVIPSHEEHTLRNDSTAEPLRFLSLYWDETRLARALSGAREAAAPRLAMVAPPTPNGGLHLGHWSGPYLAADVFRRATNRAGQPHHLVCGTDDHQSYVSQLAEREGRNEGAVVAHFGGAIRHSLDRHGAGFARWLEPRADAAYHQFVAAAFARLVETGDVYVKEVPRLVTRTNGRPLYGAFITGRCAHCGKRASAGVCEACNRPNEAFELLDPRPTGHDDVIERRSAPAYHFRLSRYRDALRAWSENVAMPDMMRRLLDSALREELPDLIVSQPAQWGIPVSQAEPAGERIFEWLEMAAAYGYAAQALGQTVERPVQFFGIDNAYYYGLLHPALYMALGWPELLPRAFVVNAFLHLDGSKFSTSRRHAIWLDQFDDGFPTDLLRLFLARIRPEAEPSNFTLDAFEQYLRDVVLAEWQPWLVATGELYPDANALDYGKPDGPIWPTFAPLRTISDDIARCYEAETFSLVDAAASLEVFVSTSRAARSRAVRSGTANDPRFVAAERWAFARFLELVAPIMPTLAENWPASVELDVERAIQHLVRLRASTKRQGVQP